MFVLRRHGGGATGECRGGETDQDESNACDIHCVLRPALRTNHKVLVASARTNRNVKVA